MPVGGSFNMGAYRFTPSERILEHRNKSVKLSPKEASLLLMLIEHKNELLLREKALRRIWNEDSYFTARSMDVYINKLRKYLAEDSSICIENIHGDGFVLRLN